MQRGKTHKWKSFTSTDRNNVRILDWIWMDYSYRKVLPLFIFLTRAPSADETLYPAAVWVYVHCDAVLCFCLFLVLDIYFKLNQDYDILSKTMYAVCKRDHDFASVVIFSNPFVLVGPPVKLCCCDIEWYVAIKSAAYIMSEKRTSEARHGRSYMWCYHVFWW